MAIGSQAAYIDFLSRSPEVDVLSCAPDRLSSRTGPTALPAALHTRYSAVLSIQMYPCTTVQYYPSVGVCRSSTRRTAQ